MLVPYMVIIECWCLQNCLLIAIDLFVYVFYIYIKLIDYDFTFQLYMLFKIPILSYLGVPLIK